MPSAIGGGFGGKLDLSVQPLVAVAAWKLGRAVRLVYERPESMQSSTKRHPATMQASAACDADGRLVAFDFAGDFNTGAYSSWGPTVANRVPIHASGPYRIANVRALTRAVLTHNSVAGAFRGFGVPQSTLLGELLIDELAAQHRLRRARVPPSQCARRRRHDADRADARGERRPAAPVSMRCGRRGRRRTQAARAFNDERSSDADRRSAAAPASPACGTASATPSSPIRRRCAAPCAGAPSAAPISSSTTARRRSARAPRRSCRRCSPTRSASRSSCVEQVMGDTDLTADAGKSSASRQTFVSGNAAKGAGTDLRRQLIERLGFARLAPMRTSRSPSKATVSSAAAAAKSARRPARPDRIGSPPRSRRRRAALRSVRRHRLLQSADGAARRRRPGRAVRDLRVRGADRRGRGRRRARHGDAAARPRRARRRPRHQSDPGRRPDPRRHRPGDRHGADGGIRQRPHRQPARLPDPDRRRRAADHGAPDRGPGAARAVGRERRRRAGAGGDGAGDPQRDPRRDRRAHARGAGDAGAPARGVAARRRHERPGQLRGALRRPARRPRALARAREDGRRQGALRSVPGALPDQPRQARRVRSLRQRRRPADPARHAPPRRQARRRSRRVAGGARRRLGRLAPRSRARRRAGLRLRHRLGDDVSRLQAGAVHRRLEARRRRPRHRRHRRHLQLLQLQGEDRHRPLPRPRAGDGAPSRRGGRPRQHDRVRLAVPRPRRRPPPHRRLEEGRAHRLRDDDGARQQAAGRARDRRRRARRRRCRQAADRRRRRGAAHARRLRLGDDRHLRAAVVRPRRRGRRRRRPHHRRPLRAPGRQVPRHGAERDPGARQEVDAGTLLPGRQSRLGLGRHRHHRSARRSSSRGMRSTARGPACAC